MIETEPSSLNPNENTRTGVGSIIFTTVITFGSLCVSWNSSGRLAARRDVDATACNAHAKIAALPSRAATLSARLVGALSFSPSAYRPAPRYPL